MAEDTFRLPLSNYDDLTHIIIGYSRFDGAMSPSDVGRAIRMHKTTVSSNNAFLVSTGLVTSGQLKKLTETGRELARALDSQVSEDIARHWRLVIHDVAFFGDILAALQRLDGMNAVALQAHVVHAAGYNKGPRVMSGAAAVVDIMKAAGLIRKHDDKYVGVEGSAALVSRLPVEITLPKHVHTSVVTSDGSITASNPARQGRAVDGGDFRVQVNIQCTVADLDGLADKLRPFMAQMSKLARNGT